MKVTQSKRDAANILIGTGASFVGAILGMRVLTQFANEAVFGESRTGLAITALAAAVSGRPFIQFAAIEDPRAEKDGSGHEFWTYCGRRGLTIGFVQSLLVALLLIILVQLGYPVSMGCILAACAICVPDLFAGLGSSVAISRNRQSLVSVIELARALGVPLLGAVCIWALGNHAVVLLGSQAFGVALVALTYWYFLARGRWSAARVPRQSEWDRSVRNFALPLVFVAIFTWIISLADRTLLARFSTMQETGRYVAVYGLVGTPIVTAGGMAARFLQPRIYRAGAGANSKDRLFRIHLFANVLAGIGIATAVVLLRPALVGAALAPPFRIGSERIVPWLAFGHAFLVISQAVELRSYADRKVARFFFTTGIAALVNVVLNLALIPRYAAEGAAIATFFSYLAYLLSSIVLYLRYPPSKDTSGPELG